MEAWAHASRPLGVRSNRLERSLLPRGRASGSVESQCILWIRQWVGIAPRACSSGSRFLRLELGLPGGISEYGVAVLILFDDVAAALWPAVRATWPLRLRLAGALRRLGRVFVR